MKQLYRTFLAVTLIIATATTQAALVANGDFTSDTDTGLDWLDHSVTAGLSFNQVTAELGAVGLFEGWQVATLDQAHTYLINAGWVGPFDSNNTSNVNFVSNFEILTTDSFTDDPLDGLGMNRYTFDPLGDLGDSSFVDDPASDIGGNRITTYSFTTPIDPSIADPSTSTFLVRATVVPVPASFWLFASGLVGILGLMKRRKT